MSQRMFNFIVIWFVFMASVMFLGLTYTAVKLSVPNTTESRTE